MVSYSCTKNRRLKCMVKWQCQFGTDSICNSNKHTKKGEAVISGRTRSVIALMVSGTGVAKSRREGNTGGVRLAAG